MSRHCLYEAAGLKMHYGQAEARIAALRGIELEIYANEFLAITGPSGSGKSTLLGLLGLLLRHTGGTLRYRGQDVSTLNHSQLAKIRRQDIGFVFQSFQLLDQASAVENVELPLIYSRVPRYDRRLRAKCALDRVGLGERFDHFPTQLSGGEQQRVAIARAIVNDPEIILADEPTGALDIRTGASVLDLLLELNRAGKTIVIITHNLEVASVADRHIELIDGNVNHPVLPTNKGSRPKGDIE